MVEKFVFILAAAIKRGFWDISAQIISLQQRKEAPFQNLHSQIVRIRVTKHRLSSSGRYAAEDDQNPIWHSKNRYAFVALQIGLGSVILLLHTVDAACRTKRSVVTI